VFSVLEGWAKSKPDIPSGRSKMTTCVKSIQESAKK
jgi:hypothetical protein